MIERHMVMAYSEMPCGGCRWIGTYSCSGGKKVDVYVHGFNMEKDTQIHTHYKSSEQRQKDGPILEVNLNTVLDQSYENMIVCHAVDVWKQENNMGAEE